MNLFYNIIINFFLNIHIYKHIRDIKHVITNFIIIEMTENNTNQ